jgi:hypothetical protein
MLRRVVSQKFTGVSEVLTAFIFGAVSNALMMEAVITSETSVNFCETSRRNIPEDCNIRTRRLENLKCHYAGMFGNHSFYVKCFIYLFLFCKTTHSSFC